MANVAVGKIGRVISFNPDKWTPTGGDAENPPYLEQLFFRHPENTYYIIGVSDFSKVSRAEQERINKNNNVVDIWADFTPWRDKNKDKYDERVYRIKYMEEWCEKHKVKFDYGIFMAGPASLSSVAGETTLMKNPDQLAKPLMMCCNYAGPIIKFLNDHMEMPWIMVGSDQKYVPGAARDLFNIPHVVMAQWNDVHTFKRRKSYTEVEIEQIDVAAFYSGFETSFLVDRARRGDEKTEINLTDFFTDSTENSQAPIRFMIVCNEWGASRYPLLKEAILDHIEDVAIYGKWKKETIGDDKRFKGPIAYPDFMKLLKRTKYSYIPTTSLGYPTQKIWEMIYSGVIPFLHTNYDSDRLIDKPDYLYVKDGKELNEKMQYLDEHPEEYEKLLAECKAMIKPEFYSGEYLTKQTDRFLELLKVPREKLVELLKK